MYPLEINHVTKRYGREVVVDDLTFTVAAGRVTGFLGPNGAGKSTTMKVLLTPQAGSLEELFLSWTSTETHHPVRSNAEVAETERQAVPL